LPEVPVFFKNIEPNKPRALFWEKPRAPFWEKMRENSYSNPPEKGQLIMLKSCFLGFCKIFRDLFNFFWTALAFAADSKSLALTHLKAIQGDPVSQVKLAEHLLEKSARVKDWPVIIKMLTSAANSGSIKAQLKLGAMYKDGYGVYQNIKTSISWFQQAAKLGSKEAIIYLAALENEHFYTHKDPDALVKVLLDEAKEENPLAQFNLAQRLSEGTNTITKEANNLFRNSFNGFLRTASKADCSAQYHIGFMLQEGKGVVKNFKTASEWYLKAANLGFAKAQLKLGMMLINGEGIPENRTTGVSWLKKAAEQGLKDAKRKLAELFPESEAKPGFPEPIVYARDRFKKAEEQARTNFLEDLSHMLLCDECLPMKEFTEPKVLALTFPSADMLLPYVGSPFCHLKLVAHEPFFLNQLIQNVTANANIYTQVALGYLYYFGEAVPQKIPEAVQWFRKGTAQGIDIAQVALGKMLFSGQGVLQNFTEGAKLFKKAAEQGNADAQNNLAVALYNGLGVPKDIVASRSWFLKAAQENDHPTAQLNLAILSLYGDGSSPPNPQEAFILFQKAAEKELPLADFFLGICYAKGAGVPQNPEKAVEHFQKAAPELEIAQLYLGVALSVGFGVPQDIDLGGEWLQKAATKNVPRAQLFLAIFSALGLGKETNTQDARNCFQKMAQSKDDLAQYNLAIWHLSGKVVPQNPNEATKWIQKAATLGNPYAQNFYGLILTRRKDIPNNHFKAIEQFQKATQKGHVNAYYNLSLMHFDGLGVPRDSEKGYEWLQKAANHGHLDAQCLLGSLQLEGNSLPQDIESGVHWVQKAANCGHLDALCLLGSLHLTGKGVPQDINEATECFKKAAEKGHILARKKLNDVLLDSMIKEA
jgi:TPR repeat protein